MNNFEIIIIIFFTLNILTTIFVTLFIHNPISKMDLPELLIYFTTLLLFNFFIIVLYTTIKFILNLIQNVNNR